VAQRWQTRRLDDSAWRPQPGLTRADRAKEQDDAAGGRDRRKVLGTEPPALASVYFRRPSGRRVYAYVRWSAGGRTVERYVCEAEHTTRMANLIQAWQVIQSSGLLEPNVKASDHRAHASWASSEGVRRIMQGNTSRDTKPERLLRSLVHRLGLRYRVGVRPVASVRRTADLVFPRARVAVFVDGCFWHGCPEHYRRSTKNRRFWDEKVEANRTRDRDTDQLLAGAGWAVLRVWEHEVGPDAALRVQEVVRQRSSAAAVVRPHNLVPYFD